MEDMPQNHKKIYPKKKRVTADIVQQYKGNNHQTGLLNIKDFGHSLRHFIELLKLDQDSNT